MKIDNIFLNLEQVEKACYYGNISYNKDIIKLQKKDKDARINYMSHLIAPSMTESATKYMLYTHCGRFHADEVFSVALILLVRNTVANKCIGLLEYINSEQINSSVKRVSSIDEVKESMDTCCVLDLLNGHYDHHHKNPDDRKDYPPFEIRNDHDWLKPVKMATFGSLWADVGHVFDLEGVKEPNKNVWDLILTRFILPIDQQDNYGPNYFESPISKVISNLNSYSDFEDFENESEKEEKENDESKKEDKLDFRFVEAVKTAYTILRNEIFSMQNLVKSVKAVSDNVYVNIRNIGTVNKYGYPSIITGVEIQKVDENEKVPSIMGDTLNELIIDKIDGEKLKKEIHPYCIINKNPDSRDGSYRLVLGRYIKLNPKKVQDICGDLINFIHPNDGFLVSFETEEKLEMFLNKYFLDLVEFQ